jgi:CO/xanthine dehydrogenase Mo-binding subunit
MDPVELRKLNALQVGDYTSTGQKLETSVGLLDTIEEAKKKSKWDEKRALYSQDKGEKRRGIGCGSVFYGVSLGAGGKKYERAGAYIEIARDGSVQIAVGTTEMGQGMRTVLPQIAADGLGVPYENIYLIETDTSRVPDSGPTVASRSTFMSGNAILNGVKQIKERLEPVAEDILNIRKEDIIWDNGDVYFKENPEIRTTFKAVVQEAHHRDIHLAAQGWYRAPYTSFNPEDGQGWCYFTYVYSTDIAEVEVDMSTGEVKVLKITAAHDVGKAINPQQVEGQIQGGTLQGVGFALIEELLLDKKGKIINPNFSTYIIPTAVDAPEIEPVIVEHEYHKGPFGAKGFGELPLMAVAPAVANAVFNATGIRVTELPITPERLLRVKSERK